MSQFWAADPAEKVSWLLMLLPAACGRPHCFGILWHNIRGVLGGPAPFSAPTSPGSGLGWFLQIRSLAGGIKRCPMWKDSSWIWGWKWSFMWHQEKKKEEKKYFIEKVFPIISYQQKHQEWNILPPWTRSRAKSGFYPSARGRGV